MLAFRRTVGATMLFTFCLIVLGAAVRLTGSGLSCPDWPLCYGLWIPTPAKLAAIPGMSYTFGQVMLEWVHRLLAGGVVGPLVLALLIWSLKLRHEAPRLYRFTALAIFVVVVQAGIGAMTVLDANSPWSVAVHLSVALVLVAVLILIFLVSGPRPGDKLRSESRWLCGASAGATLVVIASGAMMAASGASLACESWPLCGDAMAGGRPRTGVVYNVVHRFLASGVVVMIAATFVRSRARRDQAPRFFAAVAAALVLVLIEAGLGAILVMLSMPLWSALVHQACGILVFASLMVAFWLPYAVGPPARA